MVYNFATAINSVAVRALKFYAAGSGFKAQSHFLLRLNLIVLLYFFLISVRVKAAFGISSEWLRISDLN